MDWFNYVYGLVVMTMFVIITICVLVVTLNCVFRDPLKRETEAYNRGYVDGFNSQNDALKGALELDDEGLYTWATKEYSGGTFSLMPIQRQETEYQTCH